MSQLSLTVGGRSYTVSCADGEEDHIRDLAAMIDERIARLGRAVPQGDPQGLLFAGLFLADELAEARKAAIPAPDIAPAPAPAPIVAEDEGTADRLEMLASRLERLAVVLEGSRTAP